MTANARLVLNTPVCKLELCPVKTSTCCELDLTATLPPGVDLTEEFCFLTTLHLPLLIAGGQLQSSTEAAALIPLLFLVY